MPNVDRYGGVDLWSCSAKKAEYAQYILELGDVLAKELSTSFQWRVKFKVKVVSGTYFEFNRTIKPA